MQFLTSIIFLVAFIVVMFIPAILLIWASLRLFSSAKRAPLVLITIGAILLSVASLDFVATIFTAFNNGAEELARYAMYAILVAGIFRYVGMLCIAIGLIRFAYKHTPADA